MSAQTRLFRSFIDDESGATAIEYGMMLALVAVFILVAISNVGNVLSGEFNKLANKLP